MDVISHHASPGLSAALFAETRIRLRMAVAPGRSLPLALAVQPESLRPDDTRPGLWHIFQGVRTTKRVVQQTNAQRRPYAPHGIRKDRRAFGTFVFTKPAYKKSMAKVEQRYTYSGAHSAWVRACKRAGVAHCRFNDTRTKALTDTEETDGIQAARRKGAHSTEQQTSDYVRHKKPQKSKATR